MPPKNTPGSRMWPFHGLSLSAASAWSDVASLVLIACFLAGAVATFVLIQTTHVKEQYWRAATAETQTGAKVAEQQPAKAAPAVKAAPAIADASDRPASAPTLAPPPP